MREARICGSRGLGCQVSAVLWGSALHVDDVVSVGVVGVCIGVVQYSISSSSSSSESVSKDDFEVPFDAAALVAGAELDDWVNVPLFRDARGHLMWGGPKVVDSCSCGAEHDWSIGERLTVGAVAHAPRPRVVGQRLASLSELVGSHH